MDKKGYITYQMTVWCGLCQEWEMVNARTIRQASREWKENGWRKTKAHNWICSGHKEIK